MYYNPSWFVPSVFTSLLFLIQLSVLSSPSFPFPVLNISLFYTFYLFQDPHSLEECAIISLRRVNSRSERVVKVTIFFYNSFLQWTFKSFNPRNHIWGSLFSLSFPLIINEFWCCLEGERTPVTWMSFQFGSFYLDTTNTKPKNYYNLRESGTCVKV
jgi:hypothetical protein